MMAMNTGRTFPRLSAADLIDTRDVLHDFAKVLGSWLKHNRDKRKHWWHASLRPTLHGFGTQLIHTNIDFELQINLSDSTLRVLTADGSKINEALKGHSTNTLAKKIEEFLTSAGLASEHVPRRPVDDSASADKYSIDQAIRMWRAMGCVSATMEKFRAATREECSPIQLWPHHFDLSLLWLPGGRIDGQNPMDEENADQQMNFGFAFGDATIPEPYFYVTAYPFPDDMQTISLPAGAEWRSQGFNGAAVTWATVQNCADSQQYLLSLWTTLQEAGRRRFKRS